MSLSSRDRMKYLRHVMVAEIGEDAVDRALKHVARPLSSETLAERARLAYVSAAGLRTQSESEVLRASSGPSARAGVEVAMGANAALREFVAAASPVSANAFDDEDLRTLFASSNTPQQANT